MNVRRKFEKIKSVDSMRRALLRALPHSLRAGGSLPPSPCALASLCSIIVYKYLTCTPLSHVVYQIKMSPFHV